MSTSSGGRNNATTTHYTFFRDVDIRNLLTFLDCDQYHMISLNKVKKSLRAINKINIK